MIKLLKTLGLLLAIGAIGFGVYTYIKYKNMSLWKGLKLQTAQSPVQKELEKLPFVVDLDGKRIPSFEDLASKKYACTITIKEKQTNKLSTILVSSDGKNVAFAKYIKPDGKVSKVWYTKDYVYFADDSGKKVKISTGQLSNYAFWLANVGVVQFKTMVQDNVNVHVDCKYGTSAIEPLKPAQFTPIEQQLQDLLKKIPAKVPGVK